MQVCGLTIGEFCLEFAWKSLSGLASTIMHHSAQDVSNIFRTTIYLFIFSSVLRIYFEFIDTLYEKY